MKITELKGNPLQHAINEAREAEWNGKKSIDRQTIIDLEIANNTEYDENGCFLSYGNK